MIKRKGVCDVCTTEFELDKGSFAVRIVEDTFDRSSKKWTITILNCASDTPNEGFSHVCGISCLYEAIINKVNDKKTEECNFRIIGYDGMDDSNIGVLDLTDKRGK